ncbi:hypothetical protein BaRGS_00004387 [Batillaria attramentaria]|uniref:Carboxyl-terminal PDZ ligand of neuronal nitric oxide synthase protein n=1 Tax=Batillaria attramentaria TaxID=370345 RepID=A0ABD0LYG4_9CAEN
MAHQQLRPLRTSRKSQAMRIVRTIGQAFEVCHKLSSSTAPNSDQKEESSDRSSEDNERRVTKSKLTPSVPVRNEPLASYAQLFSEEDDKDADVSEEKELNTKSQFEEPEKISPPTELALKQQLLQSVGGTTISSPLGSPVMLVAIAQVHLLKDQLSAETAARIEAQARAHQLLLHNKDLLDHVSQLVTRLHGLEVKVTGVSSSSDLVFQTPPQVPVLPDPTTPRSAPVYMPDFRDVGDNSYLSAVSNNATYENTKAASLDADSPDSGHKEMSSDSLAFTSGHADTNGWSHNLNSSPTKQAPRNPFENSFNPTSAMGDRKEVVGNGDKVQIITPLPLQDASGNRLDLKVGSQAPRIDPRPEFRGRHAASTAPSEGVGTAVSPAWPGGYRCPLPLVLCQTPTRTITQGRP